MRTLYFVGLATLGCIYAVQSSADVSLGGSGSVGWFGFPGSTDTSLTTPQSINYDFPIGPAIFEVYQNASSGNILVRSPEGALIREITRSDVAGLSTPLSELDLDGVEAGEADVNYNGFWRDGSCGGTFLCDDSVPEVEIQRDGSIRLLETPWSSQVLSSDSISPIVNRGPIEVCFTNCYTGDRTNSDFFYYGRETILDPLTMTLTSEKLIAYSQESYDYAVSKGYAAVFKDPNLRMVGSFAAPEGWAITADEVRGSSGNALLSSNAGTVSVADGALRIQPSTSPAAPGTTISSSDGTLVLGNSDAHRTIVRGTLEVQDPTSPNHAANKRYVDSATSLAMAMSSLPVSSNGGPYLGFAAGTLGGETAYALGFSYSEQDSGFQLKLNLGHSVSSGTGAAVGVGIGF